MKLNCSFISVRMKRCVFIWFYSLLYLKEEKKKGGGRKRRRRKKNERGRDEKWRKSKMIEMESPSRKVEENISSSLACFFSFSFFFSLSSYLRGFQRFFQARRIRPCSPLHHAFETLFFFRAAVLFACFSGESALRSGSAMSRRFPRQQRAYAMQRAQFRPRSRHHHILASGAVFQHLPLHDGRWASSQPSPQLIL